MSFVGVSHLFLRWHHIEDALHVTEQFLHALLVTVPLGKENAIDSCLYEKEWGIMHKENSVSNTPHTSIYFKLLGSDSNVMSRKSKGNI